MVNRYAQKQEVFDIILKDVKVEFKSDLTSPFNLSCFLEIVAKCGYDIEKSIIEDAVEHIVKEFRRHTTTFLMHHVN